MKDSSQIRLNKGFVAAFMLLAVAIAIPTAFAQRIYEPYTITTFAGVLDASGVANGTGAHSSLLTSPLGVAVDSGGNIFIVDRFKVRKITLGGTVSVIADGVASPFGVAVDTAGNVYFSEGHRIRKISSTGVHSTLAGSLNMPGSADGTGSGARFRNPGGVAVDIAGNVYVADMNNDTIRKVTADGVVTTVAGLAGAAGSVNGTASVARFDRPAGITVGSNGNLYVADTYNYTIRKITDGGVVTTLAGLALNPGTADGMGSAARFLYPSGVAVDNNDNVYVADSSNYTIRKITVDGMVTTLAGSAGLIGGEDGIGNAARFYDPYGLAVDNSGNVYVADSSNNTIRKISPDAVVSTVAGFAGFFNYPACATIDSADNIYVADQFNHTIRKITPAAVVTTVAGLERRYGADDGAVDIARFNAPTGVAVDSNGNIFVADTGNDTIRKVASGGLVTTVAGLAGVQGSVDGTGNAARFNQPAEIAVDDAGNLYVADQFNHTIRKIAPGGAVTTLAGLAGSPGSADGIGSAARFKLPFGVTVDSVGNVYVADTGNYTIRKITPGGVVSTLAGLVGVVGLTDGPVSVAKFISPFGLTIDNTGNILVADSINPVVRKVSLAGMVTTLTRDNGPGSDFSLDHVTDMVMSSSGHLFISDTNNHVIREGILEPLTFAGAVSRKIHGSTTFDISLPRVGELGVECRDSRGNHMFVFSFDHDVVSGDASVTTGTGSVVAPFTFISNQMIVNLTGVADVQMIAVTLSNVTDRAGQVLADTTVNVNMLIGDTNGDKTVNASDVAQTKGQTGLPFFNIRTDVNDSGNVNASDVSEVKANIGHALTQPVRAMRQK